MVFERNWSDHDVSQLVSVQPDGSEEQVLLTSKDDGLGAPSYSPDGRRIAYTRVLHNGSINIFVMPAGAGHQRQVTHSVQRDELNSDPSFSPGEREIAYASNRGTGTTQGHIFTVRVATGRVRQPRARRVVARLAGCAAGEGGRALPPTRRPPAG